MTESQSSISLLQLDRVGMRFDQHDLFSSLSFSVQPKEIVTIMWYNGSGKSTLLSLILWTTQPTSWSVITKKWLTIGYVPQKLSFDRHLPITVKDFLWFYGSRYEIITDKISDLLSITDLLDTKISSLSWGQLQKVLVYNALAWNPQLLLLDEPTAWLDLTSQEEFYTLLETVHLFTWCAIMIVSHDVHTMYAKSDRVVCLHKWCHCIGKPSDEQLGEDLKKLYGKHITPYLHRHDHDHVG